jgi:hypothetical protein
VTPVRSVLCHQRSRLVVSGRLARRAMSQYATSPAPANGAAQVKPLSKSTVLRPVPVARYTAAGPPKLNTAARNMAAMHTARKPLRGDDLTGDRPGPEG